MLFPLVVLTILFGVYPKPILDVIGGLGRSSSSTTTTPP